MSGFFFWPLVFLLLSLLLGSFRLDVAPSFPATYVESGVNGSFERVGFPDPDPNGHPDTTAVILNWSRFTNVVKIVSLLCGPSLENTIHTVFVWNNSPNQIFEFDFAPCTGSRLRVYNAPDNLYFQARFMACAQVSTPFCFVQDDDYIVLPEVILAMRARMSSSSKTGIHLLPAHELLSSQLRRLDVGSSIHTSFAWLGHGAIFPRSLAVDFLSLLRLLHLTEDEMKMVDNYFTILRNEYPEVWFDQGIELQGGKPFTVGTEGNERNRKHINRATELLSSIIACERTPCLPGVGDIPYIQYSLPSLPRTSVSRTSCRGLPCVLETSIRLLPEIVDVSSADVFTREDSSLLLEEDTKHYLLYPLSHAVDTRADTAFRSLTGGKKGDAISLDMLRDLDSAWTEIHMVILTDNATVAILHKSHFEMYSPFTKSWVSTIHNMSCVDIAGRTYAPAAMRECSIRMSSPEFSDKRHLYEVNGHSFRVMLSDDMDDSEKWCIYEIWMRGIAKQ
ncbi:uncharacterized protein EV420DRAFT_1261735 [Desarmillaria tabescens]|uniref:Glycosyl transferase 64 domain-containing protein n=1 Tax=Armillaria tabescens TaxID=1929756 RepID=A0AA39NIQ2_ARMTA|nr:uncharacterized protein EV420DRAFT_1261735 [Desarmillaria tabescens]KAK0466356.1 hypothetical protein EV420DRAFT_1261735 [Desarmillaria tabescens]